MQWQREELNYLTDNWSDTSAREMVETVLGNHTIGSIQKKAQELNLRCRSEDGFREIMRNAEHPPHKNIIPVDAPEELGYIVGVLFSDGHLTRNRVMLGVVDEDFANKFAGALNVVFPGIGAKVSARKNSVVKSGIMYFCNPRSVIAAKYLKRRYSVEWCLKQPVEVKTAILRGLWDGDGCITLRDRRNKKRTMAYPSVSFSGVDLEVLRLYQILVKDVFGKELRIRGPYGLRNQYILMKRGYNFAGRFYKVISPTIERKRGRFELAICIAPALKEWTKEFQKQAENMRKDEKTYSQIAKKLGWSISFIWRQLTVRR